ncbi:MAG: glycosyltransferase family 4 protein [Acidobacteriota bacterium]
MKVSLSTIGKFHTFDLARELHASGHLQTLYTGYPLFKLKDERLPQVKMRSFPWVQTPYMALNRWGIAGRRTNRMLEYVGKLALDRYVASRLQDSDVFVGLSGSGLQSGKRIHALGGRYVCDRGSAHIRVQDELLRNEHDRWGLPFRGIDPRVIDLECEEYEEADCITVPSQFAVRSFLDAGVPFQKLRLLPYGVNLARFSPTRHPASDRFDVLFVGAMSLQKGIPYLLQAFARLEHPRKTLHLVGSASPDLITLMKARGLWSDRVRVWGHMPQADLKHIMSGSHVMVLPSVQEGFGMVMAQAMACACPVVASRNTGAPDLYDDGQEGYVVPERDADALAQRLQTLADHPLLRDEMSRRARLRVQRMGGWRDYGYLAQRIYREVMA